LIIGISEVDKMDFDNFLLNLKFIGDYLTAPLCLVIIAYLGFFKAKFRTYGNIEAKLQKLDKLEKIECSINDIKNNSEFDYWKRKSDLERLEKFAFMTLNVEETITDAYENLSKTIHLIAHEILKSDGATDFRYVFDKYPLPDWFSNKVKHEAITMYSIYYIQYECDEFHGAFNEWVHALYEYEESYHYYLIALNDIQMMEISKKELHKSIVTISKKFITKKQALTRAFLDADDKLRSSFELISQAIR
jgi:hypothetical protein